MWLVDTAAISARAPTNPDRPAPLISRLDRDSGHLHLSVVTIAEIEHGIAKARPGQAARKAARLTDWLEALLHLYAARILTMDIDAVRQLGKLSDRVPAARLAPRWDDLAIAAIARCQTILTRNVRGFRDADVTVHNPFETLPPDGPQ